MSEHGPISLLVGGDFCPVGRTESSFLDGSLSAEAIVGSLRCLVKNSDLSVINLECPLTERGEPIDKAGPAIRANPEVIHLLTHLGINVVTLANNHIRDYGPLGVTDTLELCASNGILTVGAGADLKTARTPLIVKAKGRRVAFINVVEQEFSDATAKQPGANPLILIDLLQDICQVRSEADHVILIVHGGLEMTHIPSPESVKLLRFLAEQNVTAVIRHHAHYVQSYERWKGVPIFYGLGNALYDLNGMSAGWYDGLLVRLLISSDNACRVVCHPIAQTPRTAGIQLLDGEKEAQAIERLNTYNGILADEGTLSQVWGAELDHYRSDYYSRLLIPSHWMWRVIRRLRLMHYFLPSKTQSLLWQNRLRCPTHREALLSLLEKDKRTGAST